jgi:nitrous oxidase accessory protein
MPGLTALGLAAGVAATAAAGTVPARVLVVGAGAQYATPAAALAAAQPGDTIRVRAGRYPGLLVVERSVTLIGEPGAVLDGERRGTVITVRAESVTIAALEVRGSGRSLDRDEAAVKLDHCRGCRVLDVTITDPLHGIYLLASRGVELSRNRITGAADLVESSRGNGIHLFNSSGNRLTENVIRGTRDGIYFSFAGGNVVTGNDVEQVRYGLHYMYSDDNRFEGNVFRRNAAGAAIMFSKRIVFRGNVFAEHVGYRAYGILLQTAEKVTAERNRIEGNLTGLFLDGATDDVFRDNIIRGNGIGVDVLASAEGNSFAGNVITDNRTAVRKVLGTGENRWSENGRGNYWGDAEVFDLDGDGIGDRPYRAGDAFASLAAARPALDVFSGTLAARALSWAEDAFPVFDVQRVEDSAPLATAPRWAAEERMARAVVAAPNAARPLRVASLAVPCIAATSLLTLAGVVRRRKAAA